MEVGIYKDSLEQIAIYILYTHPTAITRSTIVFYFYYTHQTLAHSCYSADNPIITHQTDLKNAIVCDLIDVTELLCL